MKSRSFLPQLLSREGLLVAVVLVLVLGTLLLAILDSNYRQPFVDLAKVAVGGFIGWMVPNKVAKE
jgi:hypothetical protein